jgi:hypothetical protein
MLHLINAELDDLEASLMRRVQICRCPFCIHRCFARPDTICPECGFARVIPEHVYRGMVPQMAEVD